MNGSANSVLFVQFSNNINLGICKIAWMDLTNIMLHDRSQTQMCTCCIIPFM